MITDIFDSILNESTIFSNIEKPEPLSEEAFVGIPLDSVGIGILKEQDEADFRRLDMGLLNVQSHILAEACKVKKCKEACAKEGCDTSAELEEKCKKMNKLQEAAITDYFKKFIEMIKAAWRKMVTWFKNLFKSIGVAVGNVKKSLKDADKILSKKDFSNFSYTGHEWKESKMPATLGSNVLKIGKIYENRISGILSSAEIANSNNRKESDTDKKVMDSFSNETDQEEIKNRLGELVTGSKKSMSMEQAKDEISKSYGFDQEINIKGCDYSKMISFLKNFDKSEALRKGQQDCDESYKKLIDNAQKAQDKISKLIEKDKNDKKEATNRGLLRLVEQTIKYHKNVVGTYDQLIGYCITIEKAKFSEYRSAISKALRAPAKK